VESSKSLADDRPTKDSKKPPVVYIATVNVTVQGIAPFLKDGSEEQLQEAYEKVSMEAVKAVYEALGCKVVGSE
jgi:hypothetical protein